MPEGFVVFDDVFVPWERVFLAGEVPLATVFAQSLGLWERTGGLVEAVKLSRIFVGLAQLVIDDETSVAAKRQRLATLAALAAQKKKRR